MKPNHLIAILTLATTVAWSGAAAATDRSYYVTELATQQKFDVYNDGRNTYLESIPGLVVTGATADGEWYIVNGVPRQILGFLNGKAITVVRGIPPAPKAPVRPDSAVVSEQIKKLSEELRVLTASSDAITAKQKPVQNGTAAITRTAPVGVPAKPAKVWEVRPSDMTLYGAMKRWSKDAGMQLMWETENHDVRLRGQATYSGDFDAAVFELMKSVESSEYPMRACMFDNGAVRVIHVKKPCKG